MQAGLVEQFTTLTVGGEKLFSLSLLSVVGHAGWIVKHKDF